MKFEEILKPQIFSDFIEKNWAIGPLIIKGSSDKFRSFPSESEFPSMVAGTIQNDKWINTENLKAQAYRVDENGSKSQFYDVPINMYTQLFNAGYGLCFNDISNYVDSLRELADDVSNISSTDKGISITAYLTPAFSQGILHFDHQHVFFLQASGTKHWRIAKQPAVRNPLNNLVYSDNSTDNLAYLQSVGYSIKQPKDCGHEDIVLQEGDLLYMPPGYYHVGRTENSLSLHYTLTIEPLSVYNAIFTNLNNLLYEYSNQVNKDARFKSEQERGLIFEDGISTVCDVVSKISKESLYPDHRFPSKRNKDQSSEYS